MPVAVAHRDGLDGVAVVRPQPQLDRAVARALGLLDRELAQRRLLVEAGAQALRQGRDVGPALVQLHGRGAAHLAHPEVWLAGVGEHAVDEREIHLRSGYRRYGVCAVVTGVGAFSTVSAVGAGAPPTSAPSPSVSGAGEELAAAATPSGSRPEADEMSW